MRKSKLTIKIKLMISDGRLENKSWKEENLLNFSIMDTTANTMMVETVSGDFQNVNLTYKKRRRLEES